MIAFSGGGGGGGGSSSSDKETKTMDKCLDSQLWHACAGGMVQMPLLNTKVFYFPQGHAEHSQSTVDFGIFPRIPPYVLSTVKDVKFMADPDTDEVFAKIKLIPLNLNNNNNTNNTNNDPSLPPLDYDNAISPTAPAPAPDKPASFAKTLTQSDANNGGGFSVPRYCAETIFPRLDYSADPPVQTVLAKDVHGEIWKFRHIYRGTPRRHLLTTGWSTFVNQKKLVAGDSIVFLRTENGDLCVGIRRAKRGIGTGPDSPSGWNPAAGNCVAPYGGYSAFLREDENKLVRNATCGNLNPGFKGKGRVRPESVIEAANLAANGHPFEVVYYPRASTPEFCVKASAVMEATRVQWTSGMRFKMAFETEDSSRISWFMGTVSSVQVADPIRWPGSPWRLLQVTWDEPDLLQNVKRVSPWLVELVPHMPTVHLSPFSPPRKKLRLPQHPDFPCDGQFSIPSVSSNPLGPSSFLCCVTNETPAGIQGARHAQYSTPFTDLHLNKLQSSLFQADIQRFHHTAPPTRISSGVTMENQKSNENLSCLLTMGRSTQNAKKSNDQKTSQLVLFGQPILTEQQISLSCSGGPVSPVLTGNSSSDGNVERTANFSDGSGSAVHQHGPVENPSCEGFPWYKDSHSIELGLETGHCKVFMESEDVGRTLDLSVLGSYEELYGKLASMFGIERSEMLSRVLYRDTTGAIKHTGDEPFSKFVKTAKRLTILMDSGSDNRGR